MGKVYKEAVDFVHRYASALRGIPVAYFAVGLKVREGTPETREETLAYLHPLREVKEPVAIGLFAGRMDYKKLPGPLRFFLSRAKGEDAELLREGDWRDWDAIRHWAQGVGEKLFAGGPG